MNLLIVDDDPTSLKLLCVQLQLEGHAVFEAVDGIAALAQLKRQRVDAVITDVLMPRMDGYRLCHEIRKDARLHGLPIIIYTSTYTSFNDEKLALEVGADKYLKKPISVKTILAALQEIMATPPDERHVKTVQAVNVPKVYSEKLVSKLKEKYTELEAAEVKFRTLVEQSIVGIYIIQDDQFVYVNPGITKIFGRSKEEMIARTIFDFIVPEDKALVRENIRQRLSGRMPNISYSLRVLHQSGAVLQVEIYGSQIDYNGLPAVMGVLTDVTARKQAEEGLRIAAATFETQEAIMITAPDSKILRVNQAFIDITGYSEAEMVGQTPHMLQSGRHDKAFYQAMWSTLRATGKWKGEIWDRYKNGEIHPTLMSITAVCDDHQRVTHYVAVSRDISNVKKSEQDIHQLAFYDSLTLLPNRRLLLDRLQQALAVSARNGRHSALLFLDLDHFKTINDTQGHAIGDQLLIEVARRLLTCVRQGDSLARFGGDEFVVLLEDLSSEIKEAATQTELVAEKIRNELSQPYILKGHESLSTVSIGISLFSGHTESAESLLKHADIAMYQAKAAGRDAIRFFDQQMQTTLEVRAALEKDLRQALEKNQFSLYYQIQVDSLGRPLGAEVLLRWKHPERGPISPMQFIPLAEETGLIVPIGLWVLQTACAQLKEWQNDPLTLDRTLAVNVSAKQFQRADFFAQVQRVLLESGVQPSQLKLELTESILLQNVEENISKMLAIKALGVSFSMDDFGTGYSSLQYLKRLPLDEIKIDQSFVRDIATNHNDATIVQTIIAMAEALGLNVMAEGVETEAQQEFLDLHGCHAFQGYLLGKPVPLDKFNWAA